jgi:CHAD domain-containing protein
MTTLPPESIGAVLHRRLGALVADLHLRDAEIRDRVPDGVHQARVTGRRIRSALTTFRPVVVREVTEPIRGDLRWLGRCLGDARDVEVADARMRRLVRDATPEEGLDAALIRLDTLVNGLARDAAARVEATLATDRYPALLGALDRLVSHPPWTARASRSATKELSRRLIREQRRLDRRAEAALDVREQPSAFDEAMHDVRKAAKRLRYTWEVAEPVLGKAASEQLSAARDVTRLLGERQDIVLTRSLLPRLEADASAEGDAASPWERLRRLEAERAHRIASDTLDLLKSGTLSAG